MAAAGGLAVADALALARTADVTGVMSLETIKGSRRPFEARVVGGRPHPGGRRGGGGAVAAHRGMGDRRIARRLPQGAGRLLVPLHAPGPRGHPRRPGLRAPGAGDARWPPPPTTRWCSSTATTRTSSRAATSTGSRWRWRWTGGDGRRRAGQHLRAAHRAVCEPVPVGSAAVSRGVERAALGLHAGAGDRGGAGQREQGAVPPGLGRFDSLVGGARGPRLDGRARRLEADPGGDQRAPGAGHRGAVRGARPGPAARR